MARIAPSWISTSKVLVGRIKPEEMTPAADVAGGRDRQKFGQTLDKAEDCGLYHRNDDMDDMSRGGQAPLLPKRQRD
jgi:hypothetical protein